MRKTTRESDRHPEQLEPHKGPCEYVSNCTGASELCYEGREYCGIREGRAEPERTHAEMKKL